MLRHQQKDEEAGGEGLGVVSTRKRLWKDHFGNIVTKRPRATQSSTEPYDRLDSSGSDNQSRQPQVFEQPVSPPQSLTETEARIQDDFSCLIAPEDLQVGFDFPLLMDATNDTFDFFVDSPWTAQQPLLDAAGSSADVNFDDMFNPDTGTDGNLLNLWS